ncbi:MULTISPECIES: hypothetical protein [unclassified Chryseobacterium]|uniref:hypothetical protein n=1 Tax=unclassified Chryseobacterium TaxID=2593645 RepID=UPI002269A320|nr:MULTISPECIES: hypothetical protein [unclassified Chryseobacterium]
MLPFLRIENPCLEPLENMNDVSGGKFCDLCSKKVLDLSGLNDSEILNIFQQNKGEKFCGIVSKKQLNHQFQPIISVSQNSISPRKTTFTKIAAGLALTASIVNSYPAQTAQSSNTEFATFSSSKPKKEKDKVDDGFFKLFGKVVSEDENKPISVNVSFITAQKVYTTKTNSDGSYFLEIPKEILKYESLIEFKPTNHTYERKLIIYTIKDLGKPQLIKLVNNGYSRQYGEITLGYIANEKSLVLLGGKQLDYKTFNKSISLYYDQYEIHYIPKEFVKFFTTKENIEDIFITSPNNNLSK